ncbi:MAG TPA: exodeoxyribonuclease VII large subunit, partial [Anaerolineae bacterium]
IVLARGGGSIEELWAFNDEHVARAIAASAVLVITGVGHETDFTIADFVADLRAPTPTGAALVAVPDARELASQVAALRARAQLQAGGRLAAAQDDLDALKARLARLSPQAEVALDRQRLDDLVRRAQLALRNRLGTLRGRLQGQKLFLAGLDPTAVLGRGYAIVSTPAGLIVTSTTQVAAGDLLHVRVADGTFEAGAK